MVKYKDLRIEILEILSDGEGHTVEDIERKCLEKGFDFQNKRGPIYNVAHELKNRGIITVKENGIYRMSNKDVQEMKQNIKGVDKDFEECIKKMERKLKEYKNFSWVNSTEEEWKEAKALGKRMIKLAEEINDIFF